MLGTVGSRPEAQETFLAIGNSEHQLRHVTLDMIKDRIFKIEPYFLLKFGNGTATQNGIGNTTTHLSSLKYFFVVNKSFWVTSSIPEITGIGDAGY